GSLKHPTKFGESHRNVVSHIAPLAAENERQTSEQASRRIAYLQNFMIPEDPDLTAIGSLSRRAIELAYYSADSDVGELSAQMYLYNRIPLSRSLLRNCGSEEAILELLGLNSDGGWRDMEPGIVVVHSASSVLDGRNGTSAWWRWQIVDGLRPE